MNAALDWNLWQPFFTTLAVGTVLVVAAALLLQRWILSMAWRRTIWQVAFISLGLLAITEISGAGRAAWSWLPRRSVPKSDGQLLVESKVIGEPDLRMLLAQRLQPGNMQAVQSVPDNSPAEEPVRWPGAIWLLGFAAATSWMVLARLVFLIFVPRRRVTDERLLARVNSIAHRLGGFRRVRVGETRGLAGPIAFGIFRPGISLPEGFAHRFTNEQQDAMLAHELAHLVARDPLWHALADLMTAILWWHPLAWVAKQQLRAASEAAADEASLVVENGPNVLAECLVELGGRLTRTHSLGWLGMAGADFRSGLGRRVKRLVSLSPQSWQPMRRSRVWMVRIAAPLVLLALALAATVWAQQPLGGPSTLRQAFQRSVLGLALATALPQAPVPSPETERIDWQPWSPEALAAARAEGKAVLVHFTADWAATAKVNEQTSLEVPTVRTKLRELGAVALRGDYTQDDEAIVSELRAFGRAAVPLTLVYPSVPSLPPQVLPNVLTPQIVLDALEQGNAASKTSVSKAATDSAASDKNRAPTLVLQGRSLQQAGKQAEAKAKFEEALKLDPGNQLARHYLSRFEQSLEPSGTSSVISSERGSPPLHTRWFKIDPRTFSRALFEVLKTNMNQAILEAITAPSLLIDSTGKVHQVSREPNSSELAGDACRFFTLAGVDFSVPGKTLVCNERLGQLVVRATLQDLDIIEQATQVLNTPPPQMVIETKFCEVTTNDARSLGLDWLLGGEFTNTVSHAASRKTNFQATGFLTDAQCRVVFRALEERQGVNILTPPRVTTLSGRQAQVKTVNVRYVVTDLDWSQKGTNGTVQAQPIAEPFELGSVLDVVPYVQADGHTIQMTVIPTLTEFLGYDVENIRVVPPEAKSADMQQLTPLPIFRKRQMVCSVIARDGQTVVLAGGSDQLLANPNKNEPLREGTKPPQEPKKTKLLIFVTATLIDPAGNRLHPTEEIPPGVPKQGSPAPAR